MKLWYSYLKELKLSSKSFYFYIEILMTFIILVLLLFVIPEDMTTTETEYLALDMPADVESYYLSALLDQDTDGKAEPREMKLGDESLMADFYQLQGKDIYIFQKQEDLIRYTDADRPLVGAFVQWDADAMNFKYDYYLQGYESERLRNLYLIIHSKNLEELVKVADTYKVTTLEQGYEPLNSREMALPSLLTFNGSLMGMFIIAAYIFLDKQEGVIKAYAVTASSVTTYLMSKALTLMTVSLITTMVIEIPIMGTRANYGAMLILLLTSSFFASTVGLVITSFYNNLTQAFGVIYLAMVVFMLPAIGYFIPSWNPWWLQVIPTQYLIQGFKETILAKGDINYVLLSSLGFLLAGVLLFLFANRQFKKSLTV